MKKIILLASIIIVVQFAGAQTPNWIWAQCGGGGQYSGGVGVTLNPLNNHLYLGSRFSGTCSFGTASTSGPGANNILHGRFDTSGTCKWLSADNLSSGEDYIYGFSMDTKENTYACGTVNSGYGGWYVDKYDSSGNLKWVLNPANTTSQNVQMPAVYAVAADNSNDSNNVYGVGQYTNSITVPTPTPTILTSAGDDDIFLVKIDSTGIPIWVVSAGGTQKDGGRSVVVDQFGYIYISGSYYGTATFGSFTTLASDPSYPSLFIAKYDRSGNALWVTTASDAGFYNDYYQFWRYESIAVDSCGNVYTAGFISNSTPAAQFGSLSATSAGSMNAFVAKTLSNGQWEWVKVDGGTGSDGAISVALDKHGDVYATGSIGSATAQFGSFTVTNPNPGTSDIFIAKYANSTGDEQWVQSQTGGTGGSGSQGLVVDNKGYVYVSGSVNYNVILGSVSLTASNGNPLIAKLDTVPPRWIIPTIQTTYCPGSIDTIPYSVVGLFNLGNTFTAQLSDSNGSFANATNIGSVIDTTGGKIVITIPAGTTIGSTYLIRVISSNPATSSWANGCGSYYINNVYPNDFYITIGGTVSLALSPDTSVCSGGSVQLMATGATKYTWSTGDTTGTIIVNPSVNTTYFVTGSSGSCKAGTDSVTVHVTQFVPTTVPTSQTICLGQSVNLVATGGSTYNWSPSTGLQTISGDSVVSTPTADVTYTVAVSDSAGCSGFALDTITVVPPPNVPSITQHDDTLKSSAQTNNQWYENGKAISGATGQYLIIGSSTDTFTVVVVNPADGCSSTSIALVTSGINQLSVINNQLSVYPNPTTGNIIVTISSSATDITDWSLRLTDVLGRTVYTLAALNYNNVIDLSNLPGGVYFITATNKTGQGVVKVVKE